MSQLEWDGRRLGDGCLALAVSGSEHEPVSVLAASSGDRRCTLGPEQLGDFLCIIEDRR